MIEWTLAHPWMTFFLVPILGFFVWRIIANILKAITIISRGYQPIICEDCQMSLFDEHDPHKD